jgi:hypothetical protein
VTAAAKMLGHSNPLVTLKIYTLVKDDEIDLIASSIRESLAKGETASGPGKTPIDSIELSWFKTD